MVDLMRVVFMLHVYLAQFYGHGVHEGRSPALLDNLFQALFMAPLFVSYPGTREPSSLDGGGMLLPVYVTA